MSEEPDPPVFTSDLIVTVLRRTILSPFFSLGAILTLHAQGYRPGEPVWNYSFACTGWGLIIYILSFVERVHKNASWRHGVPSLLGYARINWEDQIVVVTGGGSGLGRQLVDTLAARHVTVVALDKKSFKHDGEGVHVYACDVGNRKHVQDVAQLIREEVGQPTVLINNAGTVSAKPLLDLSEDDVRHTFDVNLLSHFWTIQSFLPGMLEKKRGHIISIGSILSWAGVVELADYCASKSALLGLYDVLRAELRHEPDIHLSVVYPGHMTTPLFAGARLPNPVARFLLPTIDPLAAAKEIIAAIDKQESRDIYVPWMGRFAWLDRGSPCWFRDAIHHICGVNHAFTANARKAGGDKVDAKDDTETAEEPTDKGSPKKVATSEPTLPDQKGEKDKDQ